MPTSVLSIAGVKVSVHSADRALNMEFCEDFGQETCQGTKSQTAVKLRLKLCLPPQTIQQLSARLYPFKNGIRLKNFGSRRLISYPEGAWLLYDYRNEQACLWTTHYQLARELSYLCALSRTGQKLDMAGKHRIHASAIALNGRTAVICGNSGSGKSSLALLLTLDHKAELFSDDFPLADKNCTIHSFRCRPAISPDNPVADRNLSSRFLNRRRHGRKLLLPLSKFSQPTPAD
ncbi:MAG TPA: hypothetical protein PLL10_01350, partial [Elusimicrobiales bacterium]|nr:hypothetical protein [Elusimicrobiales bacterium]